MHMHYFFFELCEIHTQSSSERQRNNNKYGPSFWPSSSTPARLSPTHLQMRNISSQNFQVTWLIRAFLISAASL